ncbi:NAD(P)/FAD-dependent oxidoreductase [Roseibacillus persicicus]|uniref:FAD-dependent oxidoreductase n=1 Tax=Roseibacillus persicicus TaxID=454148 RepID=UPI00398ACDA3
MAQPLSIAVVGLGSAGPASATLLARQGHRVELFERAPACEPVGAGFLLQPSGMSVLDELGILEPVLERGARIERLHVLDQQDRDLLDLQYRELGDHLFGLGLHRPVLLHYLLAAMAKESVPVHWNWEVTGARRESKGWILESATGQQSPVFDLLIVADGARSTLRQTLFPKGINRGYPWGAHWFIGHNHDTFPTQELYQVVNGTRQLAGFLATGRKLEEEHDLVSLFWSLKLADDELIRSQPLQKWKDTILKVTPRAEPFLAQIEDWSQVLTARYGDVRLPCCHREGVVILGDAAHAMSPQLGQGVNLALQDASSLARCLERFPQSEALAQYARARHFQLAFYSFSTRQLTPWFQSDHQWLSPLRKAFFRTMQYTPPARKFMTRSMAGLVGSRMT